MPKEKHAPRKDSTNKIAHLIGKVASYVGSAKSKKLKEMAERLPVGATRNIKSPSLVSFIASPAASDVSGPPIDRMTSLVSSRDLDSNGTNGQLFSNGQTVTSNRNLSRNRSGNLEAMTRNGSRTTDVQSNHNEWVEQDEPGGIHHAYCFTWGGQRPQAGPLQLKPSRERFKAHLSVTKIFNSKPWKLPPLEEQEVFEGLNIFSHDQGVAETSTQPRQA